MLIDRQWLAIHDSSLCVAEKRRRKVTQKSPLFIAQILEQEIEVWWMNSPWRSDGTNSALSPLTVVQLVISMHCWADGFWMDLSGLNCHFAGGFVSHGALPHVVLHVLKAIFFFKWKAHSPPVLSAWICFFAWHIEHIDWFSQATSNLYRISSSTRSRCSFIGESRKSVLHTAFPQCKKGKKFSVQICEIPCWLHEVVLCLSVGLSSRTEGRTTGCQLLCFTRIFEQQCSISEEHWWVPGCVRRSSVCVRDLQNMREQEQGTGWKPECKKNTDF